MATAEKTRFLVTGFSAFPGVPVNPTERLMHHFKANPLQHSEAEFRYSVLPVSWSGAIPALEAATADFAPDIAIHFGAARGIAGFRLETTARNGVVLGRPDSEGACPGTDVICGSGKSVPTALPLPEIAVALDGRGIPFEFSNDAGGYLCNYVFYHSVAGLCRNLRQTVCGFVHVGDVAFDDAGPDTGELTFDHVVDGATVIILACIENHGA